jgi:hypothetical protein
MPVTKRQNKAKKPVKKASKPKAKPTPAKTRTATKTTAKPSPKTGPFSVAIKHKPEKVAAPLLPPQKLDKSQPVVFPITAEISVAISSRPLPDANNVLAIATLRGERVRDQWKFESSTHPDIALSHSGSRTCAFAIEEFVAREVSRITRSAMESG